MAIQYSGRGATLVAPKSPNGGKAYGVCWSTWLDGRVMVSSAWTVPAGLTEGATQTNVTVVDAGSSYDNCNTVFVSGGEAGVQYQLTNQVEDSDGNIEEGSILVEVRAL